MERSKKKVDALLLAFKAWMADRYPRPMRPVTRNEYLRIVRRSMDSAERGGYSVLAGDIRAVRFVLGNFPPHPASQNMAVSALRAFYDFLVDQGVRNDNPARGIGRPPKIKGSPRPLTIEDCCAYLDTAAKLTTTHYMIAALGLCMGLRRGEIRRLRWGDFFQAGDRWLLDVDGKGGKHRREPVHPLVLQVMQWLRHEHDHATFLFPSPVYARYDQPISTDTIRQRHLEILAAAELPHYTPHQLRHSFGTYMRFVPDADMVVIQKLLGHENLSSTEIYSGALVDELGRAIDRLDYNRIREQIIELRKGRTGA